MTALALAGGAVCLGLVALVGLRMVLGYLTAGRPPAAVLAALEARLAEVEATTAALRRARDDEFAARALGRGR